MDGWMNEWVIGCMVERTNNLFSFISYLLEVYHFVYVLWNLSTCMYVEGWGVLLCQKWQESLYKRVVNWPLILLWTFRTLFILLLFGYCYIIRILKPHWNYIKTILILYWNYIKTILILYWNYIEITFYYLPNRFPNT